MPRCLFSDVGKEGSELAGGFVPFGSGDGVACDSAAGIKGYAGFMAQQAPAAEIDVGTDMIG